MSGTYSRSYAVVGLVLISICLATPGGVMSGQALAADADYVIEVSVDGLNATYLEALIAGNQLPNFKKIQNEGAWTNNARCDYDISVTLPNHCSIVTGRGVAGDNGHNWASNTDPAEGVTIHSNKGSYVASVFDVAHDNGLRTGLFVGKTKIGLIDTSYNAANGATDVTGVDNGTDKIDTFVYNGDATTLTSSFISAMSASPFNYSLIHFRNPDSTGSWGSTNYNNAVKTVDGYLGSIFNMIDTNPLLKGRTTLIVTADHGGAGNGHLFAFERQNNTIPFYVWGQGVSANQNLYAINTTSRQDPGTAWVGYDVAGQPIRNSDGANLALDLLGLGAIPGSTVNAAQNLTLQGSGPAPEEVVAYTAFNETTIGVRDWMPGVTDTEIGFTTNLIADNLSPNWVCGTIDDESFPRRFRMQGCEATTTFDAVDLTGFEGVSVSFDALFNTTTYEVDDYFRAVVTNGIDTITLVDLNGLQLNDVFKYVSWPYSATIPDSWTSARLIISSRTSSTDSTERVDIDDIFFMGTRIPEPASLCLLAMAGLLMGGRRRR